VGRICTKTGPYARMVSGKPVKLEDIYNTMEAGEEKPTIKIK